jgi:hypothetical protein
MATHEETQWCPCCKQMQAASMFRDLRGVVRETCEDCRVGDHDEFRAERELERTERRQLARYRRIFEQRKGDPGMSARKSEEKMFWNLTADPFSGLFGGKGLHADYCPMG